MIATSVAWLAPSKAASKYPLSWREYSESLRFRTSESSQRSRTVEAVSPSSLDIRPDSKSRPQNQKHSCHGAENPCDSPPSNPGSARVNSSTTHDVGESEYPRGFEAWA